MRVQRYLFDVKDHIDGANIEFTIIIWAPNEVTAVRQAGAIGIKHRMMLTGPR